jgi:hypothetical protein
MNIKRPIFFGKKGWWGEMGYKRISLLKWLWIRSTFVTKVRWVQCFKK